MAWAGMAILIACLAAAAAIQSGNKDAFVLAVFIAAVNYVIWLTGSHPAVRAGTEGVTVDNLLVRHVIPWAQLTEITARNGLKFRLSDGRWIGSVAFGGSLTGAMLGDHSSARVAERVHETRAGFARAQAEPRGSGSPQAHGDYRRVLCLSPWPPLLIITGMEAVAAICLAAR
jgi:hypothetical protein